MVVDRDHQGIMSKGANLLLCKPLQGGGQGAFNTEPTLYKDCLHKLVGGVNIEMGSRGGMK